MKVGIDFGTTYTKIAYMKDGELKLFTYPGPTGPNYIPTALAYRLDGERQRISIGEAARNDFVNYQGVLYGDRFKMLLPITDKAEWEKHGWTLERSPEEVVRDYFEQLLRATPYSLKKVLGDPESIVVSIPELWQRTANNPGAEALNRILVDKMKLPVDHLRSEPVCAAAYLVYAYQREGRPSDHEFNLLVCDMGGGTFDVALCRVKGQRIEVLDFDGSGQQGLGSAGALFDHNAVQNALASSNKQLNENDFIELLHDFEICKIDQNQELSSILEVQHPRIAGTPVYQFKREYNLTLDQVENCFAPISQAIKAVLARIQTRAQERGLSFDRVAIVGGFGQFPLVQRAILESLGINDPEDVRFDKTLHSEHRQFFAVAYGAALIANGVIETVEYYPHTIEIGVSFIRDGLMVSDFLPILEADKVPTGKEVPQWATEKGQRIPLRVLAQKVGQLPVFIRLNGNDDRLRLDLPPEEYPEPGLYYVGIQIDRSNMGTLVFEPINGGKKMEYRLGNVYPTLVIE